MSSRVSAPSEAALSLCAWPPSELGCCALYKEVEAEVCSLEGGTQQERASESLRTPQQPPRVGPHPWEDTRTPLDLCNPVFHQ